MTDIITIRVEDTHLRPNARPIDQKLVDEITESIQLVGFLPSKAVDVRRDGDIYWIVDGGHRRAAAIAAGVTEIPAVVDCLDDAGVLTVEGAANLQRPDTDQERWARAQEFFALGEAATPQAIAVATGIDVDAQAKARRVLKKLADPCAAEDVTLDQALAADEFADDDEAFAAIMNAGANWQQVVRNIESERKAAEVREKAEQLIAKEGCELIDRHSRGDLAYFGQSVVYLSSDAEMPAFSKSATHAAVDTFGSVAYVYWYGEAVKQAVDTEVQARREQEDRERAEFKEGLEIARAARYDFLNSLLQLALPNALARVITKAVRSEEHYFEPDAVAVAEMLDADEAGLEVLEQQNPIVLLLATLVQWRDYIAFAYIQSLASVDDEDNARAFLDWMDALVAAGYNPPGLEATLRDAARATLEGGDDE